MKGIEDLIHDKQLKWFGHMERSGVDSWIRKLEFMVEGEDKKGSPLKILEEVLRKKFRVRGVSPS